jgi:hypothetical protein
MPLRLLARARSPLSSSASAGAESVDESMESDEASLLAVRVLRFYPEQKEDALLKKTRFVYEIETCNQVTGDVYRSHRRFREFKRLRERLLADCRDCAHCRPFAERLKNSRLPSRALIVMDADKYGATRALQLTHFLEDLVEMVTRHARHCQRDGDDIDKSVGLFLGVSSLSEAEDLVDAAAALVGPLKTRQDRIDFRAASMPDVRTSVGSMDRAHDEAVARFRARGYSAGELVR